MIEKQVEAFYDQIAGDYDTQRFSRLYYRNVAKTEQKFVIENIQPGASVLEIGPGTGRFTEQLVQKAAHVTVIDISQRMLDQIQSKLPVQNLSIQRLSVYELATLHGYGQFDSLICMRVLPHLEDPLRALLVMAQAVKPGGNLLFDFWNLRSFVGLVRKVFRRPLQIYTHFYSYRQMLSMIDQAGLQVAGSLAWGYPRVGRFSLDTIGNAIFKPAGYSVTFNATAK